MMKEDKEDQEPPHNPYFEREGDTIATQGHLPHWSQEAKLYAVTFRLNDSLPHHVIERCLLDFETRTDNTDNAAYEYARKAFIHRKIMDSLDQGHGECLLRSEEVRQIVIASFRYIHLHQARVHAFVIMPNHVHAVVETLDGITIQQVMHSLKRYTARQINALLHRTGRVWQTEYFDRLIRSLKHYNHAIYYIQQNPRNLPPSDFFLYSCQHGGEV